VPLPGSGYGLVGEVAAGLGAEPAPVFVGPLIAPAPMTTWAALAGAEGLSYPGGATRRAVGGRLPAAAGSAPRPDHPTPPVRQLVEDGARVLARVPRV